MKIAFYIGRFMPFHNGHLKVALDALKKYEKLVFILGSAEQPRTIKNPWTVGERSSMIFWALGDAYNSKISDLDYVSIDSVVDYPYNDTLWLRDVNAIINKHCVGGATPVLVGSDRDDTTFYLQMFPNLEKDLTVYTANSIVTDPVFNVNGTLAREIYFTYGASEQRVDFYGMLPESTARFLKKFELSPEYQVLKEEFEMVRAYKKSWEAAPYPPTFVTVDAVVIQSGHILLVRRGAAPGKGLWALPGGFLNQNERALDGAIRELREETKLKVSETVLKRVASEPNVYDRPDRSLRGRTVTLAYTFQLDDSKELPKVKGGDDAAAAAWFLLNDIDQMRSKIFEDHYTIIQTSVGQLKS